MQFSEMLTQLALQVSVTSKKPALEDGSQGIQAETF
jgi:hypothetical protein